MKRSIGARGGSAIPMAVAGLAAALVVAPAPAAAQRAAEEETRVPVVRVSATGEVDLAPDRAVIAFAVETEADSAAAAAAANADRMASVIEALRGVGLPDDAIETSGYRLHPRYSSRPPRPAEGGEEQEPRIVGYTAVNEVRATVDSLPRVGDVIDAGIAAGANRVGRLAFEASDSEGARREALREAVEIARARAEALAAAAGRALGPVLEITAGDAGGGPVMYELAMAAEARSATPIQPGDLTVSESVTVVWRLAAP